MKAILTVALILMTSLAQAQCVAEVKDVIIDEARGSIIVETQYEYNGRVVDVKLNSCTDCVGRTRYTEDSGTVAEIVTKAKADVVNHCNTLIKRNSQAKLKSEYLSIAKTKTEPMIKDIKTGIVGWKTTVGQSEVKFKDKEITVNANGTYIISDKLTATVISK